MHDKIRFDDVQAAAESMPWLDLTYRQLEAGPVAVEIDFQQIDEATVIQASVDRRVGGTGRVLSGRTLFLLCTQGSEAHTYDEQPLTPGKIYVRSDGEMGRQTLEPGYKGILFLLPDELLLKHQRMRPLLGLQSGAIVDLAVENRASLLALYEEGLRADLTRRRHLCDAIVSCLCQGLSLETVSDFPSGVSAKRRMAGKVRERLEDCAEMTLGDICLELSVSERSLRRAFTEFYGTSPGQYQLTVRLHLVREDLRASPPDRGAVSRIATKHGFWHMGRFSSQYRRAFGETPTETLASF